MSTRSSLARGRSRALIIALAGLLLAGSVAGCSVAGSIATGGEPNQPTQHPPSSGTDRPSQSPPPGSTGAKGFQPTQHDWAAIQALLKQRAKAVTGDDLGGFLATVDRTDPRLVASQRTLFANLQSLPVTSVRYTMRRFGLPTGRVSGAGPVLSPPVVEHVFLSGTDRRPVANEPHDTFVRRQGRWVLGAESDNGNSPSRPWGGPKIAVSERGPLIVVMDASQAGQLTALADRVVADLASVSADLHQADDSHVLVDATTSGQVSKMNDVGPAEAAAVTFPVSAEDAQGHPAGLAGWRIKINPHQIDELISNQVVLRHELTHYVLRRFTGDSPTWLTEGVANYVGYLPTVMPNFQVSSDFYTQLMAPPHQLPNSGVFDLYPQVDYLVGQAAVTYLVQHYGTDALLRLMQGYNAAGQPLNDTATPRLLKQVDGITLGQLVAGTYGLLGQLDH